MKVIKSIFKGIFIIVLIAAVALIGFFAVMILNNSNSIDYVKETYNVADEEKVKIILDCDNSLGSFGEVDDGLVLSYLLSKPEAELLGVTTTFGNAAYDHKYTVNMLEKAGRTDIPAYQGEQSAYEGVTEAAKFLAETVAKYPGEVTIIAVGPLGNLQAAYEVDNKFFENVGQIVIMGGQTGELILGDEQIDEFNFSSDHQAAYTVLNSGANITILTEQACSDALFMFKDFQKLKNFPVTWKFFSVFWTALNKVNTGNNYFIAWDMMPAVYVFNPEYFENKQVYFNSSLDDLQNGYLRISEEGEGAIINVPEGLYNLQAFYQDMFISLNRQGR